MPHLIADRFLAAGNTWIDLATARPVRLRVLSAGSRVQQAIWSDACDTLARLRHPLVNPLVDYGALDGERLFEAYAVQPGVSAVGVAATRLLLHATRFLAQHAVPLTRPVADFALRPIVRGGSACEAQTCRGRPFGVILQHRRALDEVAEALDRGGGGPIGFDICGGAGSGLRTLHVLLARAVRLCGFAVICPAVLTRWPWIADAFLERHVCILADACASLPERGVAARLVARMGVASARCHALITFHRSEEPFAGALTIGPLGVTAMTSMVYLDADADAADLFRVAREADGRPGVFLRRLNAAAFEAPSTRAALVHETAPTYFVPAVVPRAPSVVRPRRTAGAAAAACAHSVRLCERGRHAAAVRTLTRAFRVLHGRGDAEAAARTALQLGWLYRERGRTDEAREQFERARTVHAHERTGIAAALGMAVAWTDEARLHEAEAAGRAALAAARALEDRNGVNEAALVLARVLLWALRLDEAAAVLAPALNDAKWERAAQAWALSARLRLLDHDPCGASAAASEARRLAGALGEARLAASANRAAAAAALAVGDVQAVETYVADGLAAARRCHTPLVALRLRAILLRAKTAVDRTAHDTQRLAARLRVIAERPLPPVLQWELRLACDAATGGSPGVQDAARQFVRDTGARALLHALTDQADGRLTELQHLLELCHAAPDDRSALERLCTHLCDRLHAATALVISAGPERRRLATVGRPWPGDPRIGFRALDGAIGVAARAGEVPAQAAEPIKYGGATLGVVCCRWTAATQIEIERVVTLLRLAALAAGPSVRNLLDRPPAQAPDRTCPELLGTSAAAQTVRDAIARAARAPFPVLIEGESGTGKELVARAIHRLSPRRDRRFCAINCAAIADDLLEAELFGHARGAFTGAIAERAGLFEEADGGTLFLDEVGELSPRAQAKLLRVLQDGEIRRIGENFPRRVDARVVAATNRRIADEVAAGRFRGDLRFRLDVVRIEVPPLRDRVGDVPVLAAQFWGDAAARVGSGASLAPDAIAALARHDWPGNVRELQNVIAWLAVHAPRRGRVSAALVPPHIASATTPCATSFDAAREDFERRFVRAALARAAGHRGRAARALGVSRQGLAKMLKRLGIQ